MRSESITLIDSEHNDRILRLFVMVRLALGLRGVDRTVQLDWLNFPNVPEQFSPLGERTLQGFFRFE